MKINLSWKKEYEIGISNIDAEHKTFLQLINNIYKAFNDKGDKDFIKSLLKKFNEYAEFHFLNEENMMLEFKYPGYKEHKNQHKILLQDLSEIIQEYDKVSINEEKLIAFLILWFKYHSTGADKKLGKYLNSQVAKIQ